jgi:hypothetical protein
MINDIARILRLIHKLEDRKIYHTIRCTRPDAISIDVDVPGERWEIDFLEDGTVDVEIFESDGTMYGMSKIDELFERFSD